MNIAEFTTASNGAPSFAINSLTIKLIYYQLSSYQPQLLSKHLLSNSFTINLVAITFICYQVSTAIDTFAMKPHLLSDYFAINSQLHSTLLL